MILRGLYLCVCSLGFGVVYAAANSLKDPYICGPPICGASEKFKYLPDILYQYEYTVNVNTWFAGSSENQSSLDIRTIAELQFLTPCEGLLKLSDVSLRDQDENYPVERGEKFVQALSQNELRFSFHDGVISEMCPEDAEEEWVLNFKSGLLSLFQNTMKRFDINFKGHERDIHGTCDVDYSVRTQENTSLVLVKTRDLTQCTDRYRYLSILQTVRYNFQSRFQTWPVLNSEAKCRITIDHHVYKALSCRERHIFEPFSGRNSGAMTTVLQDLVLVKEVNRTDSHIIESEPKTWDAIKRRANLLHKHSSYWRPATGELKSARDVLKLLCSIQDTPTSERLDSGSAVALWGGLVRAARGLDHASLAQLLARATSICDRAYKHIIDALPYIASAGSVELIKDMIVRKEVDGDTRDEWLMSMAMIPRPKLQMLQSMIQLLRQIKNDQMVSFTASAMLHSYCKHSGKTLRECCEEEVPKQITEEFQNIVNDILMKGITKLDRKEKNELTVAIKSLGNIGGFRAEFADVLLNVINDHTAPAPLALAAIDAFRRTPCLETRDFFLETYRSTRAGAEVRVAAYLQVMRCADLRALREIFRALRTEPVNQVATFVWSHLNNLGRSSLPSRVEIQGLLSGNTVPQLEDSPDFRMFSRNYEQGVFFSQYNAGGNYEANVIFSPDSYIPRSVSLNVTVDMFGESINVLELKARGEGFERYFESIFGNSGPLSKDKVNDQLQNLRVFRSPSEADEWQAKIDELKYKNDALKHQFPMAELGIKVFGNEISYWNAEGDSEMRQTLSRLDPKMRVMEILSGKEISYNKASLFLDTTYSVPTGSGLPLNLHLMGTSYVDMKMSGALKDQGKNNLNFEGNIHPSVALNIAATMGVVAGKLSSTGVRLDMKLYSATAVGVRLAARGVHGVKLDLALPHTEQEIFAAKSELIVLHGNAEIKQPGLNKNRIEQNTCSWSTFDKAIGIKICASYQFPNMTNLRNAPYFLMSGPAKYIVSLEKADKSAKTYSLEYNWERNETSNDISFTFDTPNSKEKRMFNAFVHLSTNSSTASLTMHSAQSTLQARALYRNMPYDKCVEATLDVDGKKQFDTVMGFKRHDIRLGYVWIPHAYWVVNDEKVAELSGTIKVKSKGGVTQWDISSEFQTRQLASRLLGYYTLNGPTHSVKLQFDYQFFKNAKQTVKFEGLYTERSSGYRRDVYGELEMDFTAYPNHNFYAVFKNIKTQTHTDLALNVSASRALRDAPAFAFAFTRVDRLTGTKLDTRLMLVKPRLVSVHFAFEESGPKYNVLLAMNFNPRSRDITVSGYLYRPAGTQLYIDSELNVTLPTQSPFSVKVKVHEKQANEYQINAAGVWFTSTDFNIDALYQDQSKTNLVSHRLKVLLNGNQFKDMAVDARFTQDNRQITFIGEGEYNEGVYRTLFRYVLLSEHNFTTYCEVDVGGKAYSLNVNADLNNNTNVNLDVHVDQLRDVHVSYQRWLTDEQYRLSAAVNWDANRDPLRKVSVDLQLDTLGAWHRAGHAALYYPGRVVNAEYEFEWKDWFCQWHIRTAWSPEDAVYWRVKMYSEATRETVYVLTSDASSPYLAARAVNAHMQWRYHDNFQALNGSMVWNEEHLAFDLLSDYKFASEMSWFELVAKVNSTLERLPSAMARAAHRARWPHSLDTELSAQFNDNGLLKINSSWQLDQGQKENNVTGRIILQTPFQGYKKGYLKTKFVFGHKKDINGVTYLDLEDKVMKIDVNGHMRRLTNSMLHVNVSGAGASGPHTRARLGFVEAERRLVAMLVTPEHTTGIEILLQLHSMQDFNVFGHIALPIQYLNRAMVTAKRGVEEAEFRVGWGSMDIGFTGIWQYRSPLDFVYVYQLYTPLEGFEQNGVVLRNQFGNGLHTEVAVRLASHKFGVAVILLDNGKGLLDVVTERFRHAATYDQLIDNFDTRATIALDTLYYPTITFDAHLMKFVGVDEEDILQVNATLKLPGKPAIVLTDTFVLEDLTVMHNTLHLTTPFPAVAELKSVYTVDITLGEKFNVTCFAMLYNGTDWQEISYKIYYEYETGLDDTYQSYVTSLAVVTPLPMLPALTCAVNVRLEDALWKMYADVAMPSFTIAARGRLELDDPFVETAGSINMTSAYLEDYYIRMEFKKDLSEVENVVGGGIQVTQGEHDNYLFADATWRPTYNFIRLSGRACLHPVLAPTRASTQYSREGGARTLVAELHASGAYELNAQVRPNGLSVKVNAPVKGFNSVNLLAEFDKDDIRGSLVSDTLEYSVSGRVLNRTPLEVSLLLVPKGQGEQIVVRMKMNATDALYTLSTHFTGGLQLTVHARAEMESNYTDLSFKVERPDHEAADMYLKARVDSHAGLRRAVAVQAATPFKRLRYLKADTDFLFGPKTGYLLCNYELPDMKADGDLKWSFLLGDLYIKALGHQHVPQSLRSVDLDIYFGNSTADGLERTDAGFSMDLDRVWRIGANASFSYIMSAYLYLAVNTHLPANVDVHALLLEADLMNSRAKAEYSTDVTGIKAGVFQHTKLLNESFWANASVHWTSNRTLQVVSNVLDYKWDANASHFVDYSLTSPLYDGDDTFKLKGSYQRDMVHQYEIVKGVMHRPGAVRVGAADVRYGGARHTDGHFNVSTPFAALPWLRAVFNINNNDDASTNRVHLYWPNKTASLNTTHAHAALADRTTDRGRVALSVPLSAEHLVVSEYYYVQGDKWSNGNATVDLDKERFVKASFKQILSKSERALDRATTDIEVENVHTPVGVKYIHEYDGVGNTDVKQATVFHLLDATKFNVTGKIDTHSYDIGKRLRLTAIHGLRTLTFENEYEAVDKELKQGSKIKWADDVWINYNIHVTNMTTVDTESQQLLLHVYYPLRAFTLNATYSLQDTLLAGRARLHWNLKDENKTSELRGRWASPPAAGDSDQHYVDLALSHPSFRKDVSLTGYYITTPSIMSNLSLELQYSDYESEYVKLNSILTDKSRGPIRDYSFALNCKHPATNLDLEMRSDINIRNKWYHIDNFYRFQKSLFFQKLRHNRVLVDINNRLIEYQRANETYYTRLNSTWQMSYPRYQCSGTVARPDGNDTGLAVLSLDDKSLNAHYNSTSDVSYHIIGMIIDTRSAKLNAWRDYDDVNTVDLASYIRLNHSRLLTSKVVWRPQILTDVKYQAVYVLKQLYGQVNESLVIIKEAPMEAHLALRNIWADARVRVREFLDDLNDLHVIKDDLDDFERFLNQSYDANDFYVKNIVEFTYYVLDEMAIRNHLESLPGIVNDMWGMMGNTSQSIRQSLTYVIDTVKKAYSNFLDSLNRLLEADFMELVSDKMEKAIMQYDTFIRDLHMKFLDYWESNWVKAQTRLSKYWQDLLKSMEPLFFKVLHYTESFVFTVWRGVMDFFYNRTQELTDSPYFNYVSTFGHAMDAFYKDLIHHDMLYVVKKYTRKAWQSTWTAVEKYVPFQDELTQLWAEFRSAGAALMKTQLVVQQQAKLKEAYYRLKWWYDYFLIGESVEKVWDIVYAKLTDLAKTALQYEEMHREPKTNFVFDPRKGQILLEQKLPMSWHAFNQTPDFSEIAEYKAVRDFLDEWLTTNKTIWSYYYEMRPYMDFNNVMPPFDGVAIMTVHGTLVTFDKRIFTVTDAGTFLLTKDYRQNNFTLLMESNSAGGYDLVVLTRKRRIHVDLMRERVSLADDAPLPLPSVIDDYSVHRENDAVVVQSAHGVRVTCSLMFRTCKIQVTGWYYASVGGLLGTYNNEMFDDFQLPNNTLTDSIPALSRGWRLSAGANDTDGPMTAVKHATSPANDTQCEKFFQNKVSPLHPCFSVISADPFFRECASGVEACALASTYLELCSQQHIPIHMPEQCLQCKTPEGDTIEEGSMYTLPTEPQSIDVVFVVEAAYCNRNLRKRSNMELLLETLDSKLQSAGLVDNRYAIIGYGGSGAYRRPRALYVDNQVFATASGVARHFDNFVIEKADLQPNASSCPDVFSALTSQLLPPSAAPRALLLMPCSRCAEECNKLDYSTIYHNLMESSVTLHILTDEDFRLSKKRAAKYLFGVDSKYAYTNKDYERLVGDASLRKQVRLPKERLGLCTSLAMETNGTIFSRKKMSGERSLARRVAAVCGARLAAAAPRCRRACECRDAALACRPCASTLRQMELSFWNSDDIEDFIDRAMEPSLPGFR